MCTNKRLVVSLALYMAAVQVAPCVEFKALQTSAVYPAGQKSGKSPQSNTPNCGYNSQTQDTNITVETTAQQCKTSQTG